ncbi:MAG: hypothetical protein FDZ69_09010 [Deltaproteobacteria bacterium]|nr:MAG: hypothetical protein FDZ69_09010 [Deltaproteobacteria bacterium]
MSLRDEASSGRLLTVVLLSVLAAAALVTALVPINSNDLWWHLKTGDVIRANGALPDGDPFSYLPASDSADPARPQLILRQYWLAQVAYSLVHGVFGLAGIVWLRAALCAAMILAAGGFLWRATRSNLALLPLLPLTLALRVMLEDSDRPHLFVFASTLLVVIVLEYCARTARSRPLFLLVPLQLAAAQLHPGFAVGTLTVAVYAGCALREPRLQPVRRALWLTAGACLLVFLLNPNGLRLVPSLFGNAFGARAADVLEFQSPLAIWRHVATEPGWLACAALVLATVPTLGLLLWRRCFSAAAIAGGLALAALLSMRYLGFFLPVAALLAGLALAEAGAVRWSRRHDLLLAPALVLLALVLIAAPGHGNRGRIRQLLQPGYFPVRAADYLAANAGRGHLFNFDAWGGYLSYRLWPRQLIFTDTRVLSGDAAAAYREILADTPAGRDLLQRHDIDTVVMPSIDIYSGELYPLVRRLAGDARWSLVHVDDIALVFARQPDPRPALAREMAWFQVLRQVEAWQPRFPWAPGYQRTRAEAAARLGRP